MTARYLLPLNLMSVYVTAFALSTYLHELAHAFAASLLGVHSTLFHTYTSYPSASAAANPELARVLIAAAGPLFSLLQMLAGWLLLRLRRQDGGLWRLLYIWLTMCGAIIFFGYLAIGPFVPDGDTGKIIAGLGITRNVALMLSALGIAAVLPLPRLFAVTLGEIIGSLRTAAPGLPGPAWLSLHVMPLLAGAGFCVLLSLPAPTPISLAAPICISLVMISMGFRLARIPALHGPAQTDLAATVRPALWPLLLMLAMLILSRVMAMGISF